MFWYLTLCSFGIAVSNRTWHATRHHVIVLYLWRTVRFLISCISGYNIVWSIILLFLGQCLKFVVQWKILWWSKPCSSYRAGACVWFPLLVTHITVYFDATWRCFVICHKLWLLCWSCEKKTLMFKHCPVFQPSLQYSYCTFLFIKEWLWLGSKRVRDIVREKKESLKQCGSHTKKTK